MDVTPASPGCLTGICVLDLTQFEAGTTCTEALAWMGADIAKVEKPKGGEAGRTGFGDAYYFMMYNANKRSITVNLKSDRGLVLVKEMVKKADVFTESCRWRCRIRSCITAAACSSRRRAPAPRHRAGRLATTRPAASIRASLATPTITSTC